MSSPPSSGLTPAVSLVGRLCYGALQRRNKKPGVGWLTQRRCLDINLASSLGHIGAEDGPAREGGQTCGQISFAQKACGSGLRPR
jgi:hypothetical protein